MQEGDLKFEESTTEDEDFSTSQTGEQNLNLDFRIDGAEDVETSSVSDPSLKELLKQSTSVSKEIDSVMTSTDESDEDSFRVKPSLGTGSGEGSFSQGSWDRSGGEKRSAEAASLVAAARRKQTQDPKLEIKKLNEKVKLLLDDRKLNREIIESQNKELSELRGKKSAASADKIADLERQNHDMHEHVAKLKADITAKDKAAHEKSLRLKKEHEDAQAQVAKLQEVNKLLEERLKSQSAVPVVFPGRSVSESEHQAVRQELENLKASHDHHVSQGDVLRRQLEEKHKAFEEAEKYRAEAEAKAAQHQKELSELQIHLSSIQSDIDKHKEEAQRHKREAVEHRDEAEKLKIAITEQSMASGSDEVQRLGVENLDLHDQLSRLREEVEQRDQIIDELKGEADERSESIRRLETRVDHLLEENNTQTRTIEAQNDEISRLGYGNRSLSAAPSTGGTLRRIQQKQAGENRDPSFTTEFAQLDAALAEMDNTSTFDASPIVRGAPNEQSFRAELDSRDAEILELRSTVQRLESLAFDRSESAGETEDVQQLLSQVEFLRETSGEQKRTIQLQKSTIESLKEEVELLTGQVDGFHGDNVVNVDKQKKVAARLRADKNTIEEERSRLDRDKAEFAKHLAAFKELRRAALGGAVLTVGGGVSKARYRELRRKRDKYKRKDYRKGKECNTMQKRLFQHVEMLEVDDSQSSSQSGSSSYTSEASTSMSSSVHSSRSTTSRSVQLVQDSSSEADSIDSSSR